MKVLYLLAGPNGAGNPFITETVFSHPSKTAFVAEAAERGYAVELKVILVPRSIVVARVQTRGSNGDPRWPIWTPAVLQALT